MDYLKQVFIEMPEFITSDVRVHRPIDVSYRIDADFMQKRHESMLPLDSIKNKRILDLGSAVSATGAWVLENGASYYTAVEIQAEMAQSASQNLKKYFSEDRWEVANSSIEEWLDNNTEIYDIIVISGVIYGIIDYYGFLSKITKIAKEMIVIESMHPWKLIDYRGNLSDMDYWRSITEFPIVQYTQKIRHSHSDGTKSYEYDGVRISIGAFDQIFQHLGWRVDLSANCQLEKTIPDVYNVEYVTNLDPDNPGDAHLVNVASGPRFVIQCFPSSKQKYDFISTFNKEPEQISFKMWKEA